MSNLPEHIPGDPISALNELNAKPTLSVEDMKLLILVECGGTPFYNALADTVDDDESKTLLRKNGQEETAHAHRLKKAIEILTGEDYVMPAAKDNPYMKPAVPSPCSPDFLRFLEGIEINGDAQYQVWADNVDNAEVADLLRQNGREETRHAERVGQVLARLEAAAS